MVSWRKSTYSDGNGGSCVEVAGATRVVLVRDTKDRDGRTLAFSVETWRAFAEQLKRRLTLCPRGGAMSTRLPTADCCDASQAERPEICMTSRPGPPVLRADETTITRSRCRSRHGDPRVPRTPIP
jgi:hypothetical protein